METKRAFKGIWIPAYVWNHPELQAQDIQVWAEIDSFSHNDGSCFASNSWLSEKFNCNVRTIQRSLIRLKNAGLIEIEFKGNPKNKETKRYIRSVDFKPTPRQSCHTPMTQMSYPHDTDVIHNNTKNNNTKNKIKLHSPSFSDENKPETEKDNLPSNESKKTEKESPLPPFNPEAPEQSQKPEPNEKYKLTPEEYKILQSYYKGFCEAIDRVAKVKYKKDFKTFAGIYHKINKDMGILKSVYSYFCTYRNFDSQYILEIRSLNSLSEKFDKLISETKRETFRKIQESNSVILHIDSERMFYINYPVPRMSQRDYQVILGLKSKGYKTVAIDPQAIPVNLTEAGYDKPESQDNGKSHYSHLNY